MNKQQKSQKLNLLIYIKRRAVLYTIGIMSLLLSVSLIMFEPVMVQHIIDDVIIGKDSSHLAIFLGGFIIIGVGRFIFQYIKEFCFDIGGSAIARDLRFDVFKKMQNLSASFYDKNNSGELMSRVKDDVDRIWDCGTYIGMLIIEVTVHTSLILYCLYSLNPVLALLPTLTMIAAAAIAIIMERKLDKSFGDIAEENAALNNTAQENLNGVRTVKSFTREIFEFHKFQRHSNRYYELNVSQSKIFVKYDPIIQIFTKLLPMAVLLTGGYFCISKKISIGELNAFVMYCMNALWPMEMLGWLTNGFAQGIASAKRLDKIFQERSDIQEIENVEELPDVKGNIVFDNVSYTSKNGKKIIDNVSFEIKAGQTLGIMGETGSGKTTLINLLMRMYDVTGGAIYVDGVDVRSWNLSTLRKSVATVMQDVFLFSNTIEDNIVLGAKDLIDERSIDKAIDNSCAKEFVAGMKDGKSTIIGERGVGLSGGQKQRITIARALSHKTPVLVLDDSTSALDTETEQQIQKTLQTLSGMTKIIIGHRISAVKNADKIIVLNKGSVAESGTHEQLLAEKGLYYETYKVQFGDTNLKNCSLQDSTSS